MSKLGKLGSFFKKLGKFAPLILAATPLAPIAPMVVAAIAEAEAIKGAGTGAEKAAHVKAIVIEVANAINAQKGTVVVDPAEVEAVADNAISTIISVVNLTLDDLED